MKAVLRFLKKDMVLTAAWVLAVISMFFVKPDMAYIGYIDFRSLGILWSLMIIMQCFRDNQVFARIGSVLVSGAGSIRRLLAVLVGLCFVSSMLITNDVALITFVPFSVLILRQCSREDLLIPTLVLQTIAANLGSMLTPVGNPQNLYLYGISQMSMGSFLLTMLPYTLLSALLLAVCVLFIKTGTGRLETPQTEFADELPHRGKIIIFVLLFILALLTVIRLIPWQILTAIVLVCAFLSERKTLGEVDYALLATFIGFFIFTGNIARIPAIHSVLETAVKGHELAIGILASQCISNVPAALLLSGFTQGYTELLLGVNFGGLGTLIASMASLISYKQFTAIRKDQARKYIVVFTLYNLVFLAALILLYLCQAGIRE